MCLLLTSCIYNRLLMRPFISDFHTMCSLLCGFVLNLALLRHWCNHPHNVPLPTPTPHREIHTTQKRPGQGHHEIPQVVRMTYQSPPARYQQATPRWGGDRVKIYRNNDKTMMVISVVIDRLIETHSPGFCTKNLKLGF